MNGDDWRAARLDAEARLSGLRAAVGAVVVAAVVVAMALIDALTAIDAGEVTTINGGEHV